MKKPVLYINTLLLSHYLFPGRVNPAERDRLYQNVRLKITWHPSPNQWVNIMEFFSLTTGRVISMGLGLHPGMVGQHESESTVN